MSDKKTPSGRMSKNSGSGQASSGGAGESKPTAAAAPRKRGSASSDEAPTGGASNASGLGGQNMTEKTAAGGSRKRGSSSAPTTAPAGSGATSAAADAASTSTATTSAGKGSRSGAGGGAARAGTSKRESLQKTPDSPATGGSHQSDDRDERIRRRAYELWEAEGWPQGREQDHWAQAERELMGLGGGRVTDASSNEDRAGVVAPPAAGGQPGVSDKLGGTPSAARTAGRSRRGKA